MPGRLHDKVSIVTGGAAGIGEAISHKFAAEGAKVVVAGLPGDPVDDVVRSIRDAGGEATSFSGDVADEAAAGRCVDLAVSTYGRLDVLVNNAGVFLAVAEIDEYPVDLFDATLRNNLRSAFLMTRAAMPHLRKTKGNVVCAGSEAGYNGLAMNAPYGGTKGFMHSFAKGVAVEQAKYGVRCNCVCPGAIDTAWTHKETGPMTAKMEESLVEATPIARRGTPEEMANVYAFIASDEASYVTGALWLADGGVTVAKGAVGKNAESDVRREPGGAYADLPHRKEGLEGKPLVTKQ